VSRRVQRARGALVGLLCAGSLAAAAEPPQARQIDAENASQLLIGGPDAIGGIGDWYLANDRIEVIVDDPSRRHAMLNHGGTIVDAGLRDRRDEDQLARLVPLVNLTQRVVPGYDAIRAEQDDAGLWARLVVTSPHLRSIPRGSPIARGLDVFVPDPDALRRVSVETRYEVRRDEPFVRITTRLENNGSEPAPVFSLGDLWMRGGRSLRAFVGDVRAPDQSRGFAHRSFSRNLLGSLNAMASFSHVAMAGRPPHPPIVYALCSPERTAAGLPFYGVSGEHVTLAAALLGDDGDGSAMGALIGSIGEELAPGASWEIERRLLIVAGEDVAAATDVLFPLLEFADGSSGLGGRSLPPEVRAVVHVETAAGQPVTQIVTQEGHYRALLPAGDYRLRLLAPQREPLERHVRVSGSGFARVEDVHWAPLGALRFDPAFADAGAGRIRVRGRDGTPDPVFAAELLGFTIDGAPAPSGSETSSLYFVGNRNDPVRVPLAPGRYRLVATRGPEFSAEVREVEVPRPGAEVDVAPFALERVVRLDGFLSADLHVHAEASDDSQTGNAQRLRDFVAAGVEVIVGTDHDHVPDYDAALADEDLGGRIRVVRGVEVTSSTPSDLAPWTIGHHNAWPHAFEPYAHRKGAPPSQQLSVGELYSLLRREHGARVVQLNHPRGKGPGTLEGNYFTHLAVEGEALDATRPLEAPPNAALLLPARDGTRALDFDVIELMNGDSWSQYLETRSDFHWLLRQGVRRTATANSDTHGPDELAGYPRNYVQVPGGLAGAPAAFDAALRLGRSFGTTGPLIVRFLVNGAEMGDVVAARDGRATVEYSVAHAPWVPLDEVRLLVNGEIVRRMHESEGALELVIARDAFVTLEAGAPVDIDPALWRATHPGLYRDDLVPGFLPAAFSNPIYVDADGDGRWRGPGLLPESGESGSAAASLVAAALAAFALLRVRAGRRRA